MTLIRTSVLSAIAVAVKMLTLLGINKVLAIYVGPAGFAALGQFQNAIQMITSFASGAINTGVTKYTAEYHEDEARQRRIWQAAGTIAFAGSAITTLFICVFSDELAIWFLKDERYGRVFIWFALALVFFVFNSLLLAILNGKKEILRYVIANIFGSIFSLLVTGLLVVAYGLYGALVGLATYQSLAFFVTVLLCWQSPWFKFRYIVGRVDWETARNLGKFVAMALTSAACVPLSHIFVRNHLGSALGWEAAGYWEAVWRMSSAYLMLVTTTLSVYYLPRLSELKDASDVRREIAQGYRVILPVAAISGLIIYMMRDFIIAILFTADFSPARDLFAWQMVGDTLKIGSWILAYVLIGRSVFVPYIVLEIFSCGAFVVFSYAAVNSIGLQGVVVSHVLTYALYWALLAVVVYRYLARPYWGG